MEGERVNAFVKKFLTFDKKVIHGAAVGVVAAATYLAAHPATIAQIAAAIAAYPTMGLSATVLAIVGALYVQAKQ